MEEACCTRCGRCQKQGFAAETRCLQSAAQPQLPLGRGLVNKSHSILHNWACGDSHTKTKQMISGNGCYW